MDGSFTANCEALSMKKDITIILAASLLPMYASAQAPEHEPHAAVADAVIAEQRQMLEENTRGAGFGPQSPRDIDAVEGRNSRTFSPAPASTAMNLCNIHMHKNAEHKGGEFTTYAGNGDGYGYHSGFQYSGELDASELEPLGQDVCPGKHGGLSAGDTVEVHYVYSSAQVAPGPTLGACLSDAIRNPQLKVETQVYVLVNDDDALDFSRLTHHDKVDGLHQALNIPDNTGTPVEYAGSTTGPTYNEKGSPFQVAWRVRPEVARVAIESVGEWCEGNVFEEDHAHGVRNLVTNPDLLSTISD